MRAPARAHHDGHGRGQAHGAGAGHDQHGHEHGQRRAEGFAAENQPGQSRQHGKKHNRRHEIKTHPVGQTRDGGLAALSLAHQTDDARQTRVPAHGFRAHGQRTLAVDAARHQLVPRPHRHGYGFAGQQGEIHGALAGQHNAVHGHAAAGPDQQAVARAQIRHRRFFRRRGLIIGVKAQGGLRREAHQRAHSVAGLAPGRGFQKLAQLYHGQQHGAGLVIKVHGPHDRVETQHAQHGIAQAVQKGRARAHGHQAVHSGGFAQQGRHALKVKMPSQPDHRQGQQQLQQHEGAGRAVRLQPGGQAEAQHMPHGDDQQRRGKTQHGPEAAQTLPPLLQGFGF